MTAIAAPAIANVEIPDAPMKVGDQVSVRITVGNDGGEVFTLFAGTVGGYTLTNLTRVNATTYTAKFTITATGVDVAAADDLQVNVVLANSIDARNAPYTEAISQSRDSINANAPSIPTLSNPSVLLTAGANALVGTLNATDASPGDTQTYAFAPGAGDTNNTSFSIVGNTLRMNDPPLLGVGTYSVRVMVTDLGNNTAVQTFTINVVPAGPSVTAIARDGAASSSVPSAANAISYSVVFSEAVTGVDSSDFTLAMTGTANGTISTLTTTDNITYTVTVSGLAGDGTIGLNLNTSGTGIQNLAARAITGGFTGGQTYTLDHTVPGVPSTPVLTAITDTGVNNNDGITSTTSPAFTGTGEIGSTVKLYDASHGNALIGSATVDGTGHYTITPTAPLTAGAYAVYAQASDAAANTSAASGNLAVTIDTAAPTAILLPTSTVYTNAGLNATVGTLGATDAISAGAFTYQLVPGIGAVNNADFTLSPAGVLKLNDPTAVGIATESIRVQVTDAAGNVFTQVLQVNVAAAPATPAPPGNTAPATVDGVPVTTATTTLPGGGIGTLVTVPVVSPSAGGVTGAPNVADIPLVSTGSSVLLNSQVPIGMGLTATGGASKSAGASLADLIAAIKSQTTSHTTADQAHLTGNVTQFVSLLSSDVPLLVNTVVLQNVDVTSSTPLTLTGTSTTSQHTALLIDTSLLPRAANIVLNNVDFAAVVGAVTITGSTAGQIISADVASQTVIVSSSTASQVFAGGGNDILQYGLATVTGAASATTAAALVTNSSTAGSLTAATAVLLNGGTGNDTAVFGKAQSAYSIDQRDGYILLTDTSDSSQKITVTNTENLRFSDGVVNVQSRSELTTLAGLYQTAFGRQADIGGFDYWGATQAKGVSLGTIAVNMLGSNEAFARGFALNGDSTHDITVLYKAVFGRDPEATGLAYWQSQMAHGQSIVDVANGFMAAPETSEHKLAVTGWDMTF